MPVVKVEIAKVKVERHSTAKCQHCKKIFDIKSLESHIKAVEKEERIKKSAQILKDKKDAREIIAQKQKEKDSRVRLILCCDWLTERVIQMSHYCLIS